MTDRVDEHCGSRTAGPAPVTASGSEKPVVDAAHVVGRRNDSAAALARALESEFTTAYEPVSVGAWHVELLRPRNSDDLISEADFVRDERLPYWADLWPAARVLAAALSEGQTPARGPRPRLLELGCGLGLATIAALRAGYDVVATDYYPGCIAIHTCQRLACGRATAADTPRGLADVSQ